MFFLEIDWQDGERQTRIFAHECYAKEAFYIADESKVVSTVVLRDDNGAILKRSRADV